MLSAACAPATTNTRPVSSAAPGDGLDPEAPRANLVSAVDDPNAVPVASAIRKVTVYSDRALVTRRGTVQVAAASGVYAFRRLPGWVDESSVRVASSAGRIVDVRVVRGYLARATDPRVVQAEATARELNRDLLALDDELEVLDAQAKQVEDIKTFSLDRLNDDVTAGGPAGAPPSHGSVGVNTYAAVVDFIAKKLREIGKGRRDVNERRAKLVPAVEASKKVLEELHALTQLEETKVLVTVQGSAPGPAELELTYLLPGATWESAHEVRTTNGVAADVELTSYALVTQASGEDWDGAELAFSTQSSTSAVRIPVLEALTLGESPAATQVSETRSASFERAESAFKEQNRLWNQRSLAAESSDFEASYRTSFESLQLTQSKTIRIFQSLEQRGTTTQFKAAAPARVRADGRSVRVPIGRTSLKARRAIVAAPEQSLNAAQTLELRNDSGQSLLPGSVAMYQGGAFLGMTNIDFVAAGERFALFESVADELKLSRVLDKKRSALVRKQRTQMQLAFVVTVENLSSQTMPLELADRVPVSEDRDIVISNVKLSPGAKPDSKGILRWPLSLAPGEKRKLEIQYQIEYPPTLVLEMRRERDAESARALAAPSSPLPAPRRAHDLKRDIQEFEAFF